MEEEARDILRTALAQESAQAENLADAIRKSRTIRGFELPLPPRGPMREPPDFS